MKGIHGQKLKLLSVLMVSLIVLGIVLFQLSGVGQTDKTEESTRDNQKIQETEAEAVGATMTEQTTQQSKPITQDTELVTTEPAPTTESVTVAEPVTEAPTTKLPETTEMIVPPTTEQITTLPYVAPPVSETGQYIIAIDAGHQAKGNSEKEPIGPGASEMKAKVSSGTSGVVTGIPEYQLTLTVAWKLKAILEARGYQVIMIRETHDVNISNAERAEIANQAGAHAFIRIHADGIDNSSVHGMSALCQSSSNPYNSSLASYSYKLSECVINAMAAETGAKNRGVKENDVMSGINWAQVPVTIIEMGFMTNAEEDLLMSSEEYQNKLATGMANGIDAYFFQ